MAELEHDQSLDDIRANWIRTKDDFSDVTKIKEFIDAHKELLNGLTSFDIAQLIERLRDMNEDVNMIFLGPPRSGKSTLCEKLLTEPDKEIDVNHGTNRKKESKLIKSAGFRVYDSQGLKWKHKEVISWLEKQQIWKAGGVRLVFVFTSTSTVNQSDSDIKKDYVEVIKYLLNKNAIVFLVGTKLCSAVLDDAYDTLVAENRAILDGVLQHFNNNVQTPYTFDNCSEIQAYKGKKIEQWRCPKLGLYGCMIDSRRNKGMDYLLDMVKNQLNAFSILELLFSRGDIGAESFALCVSSLIVEIARLTGGTVAAESASENLYKQYSAHYDLLMEETHGKWVKAGNKHVVNLIAEKVKEKLSKKESDREEMNSMPEPPEFDPMSMWKPSAKSCNEEH